MVCSHRSYTRMRLAEGWGLGYLVAGARKLEFPRARRLMCLDFEVRSLFGAQGPGWDTDGDLNSGYGEPGPGCDF